MPPLNTPTSAPPNPPRVAVSTPPRAIQPARGWQRLALLSAVGLIALGLLWELWGAPLRPGGSWLALKVVPLIFTLRGLARFNNYTFQWSSMLSLLYVCEALVRATSDRGPSVYWAWVELGLALTLFISALAYTYPYKKQAKALKKAQQAKDSEQ